MFMKASMAKIFIVQLETIDDVIFVIALATRCVWCVTGRELNAFRSFYRKNVIDAVNAALEYIFRK